jgi:hypothetical protein
MARGFERHRFERPAFAAYSRNGAAMTLVPSPPDVILRRGAPKDPRRLARSFGVLRFAQDDNVESY